MAVCSSPPSPERKFWTALVASVCSDSTLCMAPLSTSWNAPPEEAPTAAGAATSGRAMLETGRMGSMVYGSLEHGLMEKINGLLDHVLYGADGCHVGLIVARCAHQVHHVLGGIAVRHGS